MKVKSAKGTKGFLIGDNTFRVYGKNYPKDNDDFTDYSIAHTDLEIEIIDEDAELNDQQYVLDHSRAILGYK